MRRVVAIAAAALALVLPQAAGARSAVNPPPFPPEFGQWTHVQINQRIAKQWHTLILDRGRITSVNATQLQLLESDGSAVTVPLDPTTRITFRARPLLWSDLRRRMLVETMRIDGGAAVRVRIVGLGLLR